MALIRQINAILRRCDDQSRCQRALLRGSLGLCVCPMLYVREMATMQIRTLLQADALLRAKVITASYDVDGCGCGWPCGGEGRVRLTFFVAYLPNPAWTPLYPALSQRVHVASGVCVSESTAAEPPAIGGRGQLRAPGVPVGVRRAEREFVGAAPVIPADRGRGGAFLEA